MQNGDINVTTETLNQGATDIRTALNALQEAVNNTKAAGEGAISAVGGTGTKLGAAINGKLVSIDEAQFKKALESLDSLAEALTKTGNEYDAEESELLKAVEGHVPASVGDITA